jgi:hypothetical protein
VRALEINPSNPLNALIAHDEIFAIDVQNVSISDTVSRSRWLVFFGYRCGAVEVGNRPVLLVLQIFKNNESVLMYRSQNTPSRFRCAKPLDILDFNQQAKTFYFKGLPFEWPKSS